MDNSSDSHAAPLAASPLAPILERRRVAYNTWFATAARAGQPVDPVEFTRHLAGPFKIAAEAVHAVAPAALEPATDALFRVSLELFSRGQFGTSPHTSLLREVWTRLLPAAATPLAVAPRAVAAALSNMAVNIAHDSPSCAARWLGTFLPVAPACQTPDHLLHAAMVLAWRSGLPHYRDTAISRWRELPDTLRRATFGLAPGSSVPHLDGVERNLEDPWLLPGTLPNASRRLTIAGIVGNFRGFGGNFREPPLVAATPDTLYAYDGEASCTVHADCFGATLRPARKVPDIAGGAGNFKIDPRGNVRHASEKAFIPELANSTSHASLPHMLVVSLPHSHHLYIIASIPISGAA